MANRAVTKDFTQFYTEWKQVVTNAVYKAQFHDPEAEDLVQEIFTELYAGHYLEKYDHERGAFSTYIWGHVNIRIKGRKRELWKRSQREFLLSPQYNNEGDETAFSNIKDESETGVFTDTELSVTVDAICQELDKLPATKSKNLARLFRDIVKQVTEKGEFSQTELAKEYGCSRQAISYQVSDLARCDAVRSLKEFSLA